MGVFWARKLQGGFHHSVEKQTNKLTKLAYSGTNRDTNRSAVTSNVSTPFPGCEYLERRGHGIITWNEHMPLPFPPSQITLYQWNENRVKRQNKFFAHTHLSHIEAIFSGCIEDSQNVSLLESQLAFRVWVGGAFKRIVIIESNKLPEKKSIMIMALKIEDEGK